MPETMQMPGQSEMADSDEQSVTLDPAQLGGKEYNAGDTIMLKVVGHTSDGMLKAVCQHEDGEKADPMADFDQAMAPPSDDATPQQDSGGY